jgi:hypothetical protein
MSKEPSRRAAHEGQRDHRDGCARFPEGVDEVHFRAGGVIKDIERFKGLFELFAETLSQLCRIGSATKEDPGVEL